MAGAPCTRGLRIRVVDILDLLEAGLSPEKILEELPDLELADIAAAAEYAATSLPLASSSSPPAPGG